MVILQSFALDLWHHVVVIRSNDEVSLSVNGELDWTFLNMQTLKAPLPSWFWEVSMGLSSSMEVWTILDLAPRINR